MAPLGPLAKFRLALDVWRAFALVRPRVFRRPLPDVVVALGHPGGGGRPRHDPRRLGRAVDRTLRLGGRRPTCVISALVLFRLLRRQGDPAEVVIGLPAGAAGKNAHAWVEVGGRDVGPPPGRGRHEPLARFS